jgi:hypothetical protein
VSWASGSSGTMSSTPGGAPRSEGVEHVMTTSRASSAQPGGAQRRLGRRGGGRQRLDARDEPPGREQLLERRDLLLLRLSAVVRDRVVQVGMVRSRGERRQERADPLALAAMGRGDPRGLLDAGRSRHSGGRYPAPVASARCARSPPRPARPTSSSRRCRTRSRCRRRRSSASPPSPSTGARSGRSRPCPRAP